MWHNRKLGLVVLSLSKNTIPTKGNADSHQLNAGSHLRAHDQLLYQPLGVTNLKQQAHNT